MLESINKLDQEVFLWLNSQHNDFFDVVMSWITLKYTWFPFYGLLVIFLLWKFRLQGLYMILAIALVIVLCDQFTSSFMKPYFERLRPCYEPALADMIHVVEGCGGKYGFASSHAANAFGLATIVWLLLRNAYRYLGFLFVWAAIVSYSRIYMGVHYPSDVIIGSLCGFVLGWLVFWIYTFVMDSFGSRKEFFIT